MIDYTKAYRVIGKHPCMYFISFKEKRPPRKGEYFLSGAIPEVYKAVHDMTQKHIVVSLLHVAKQKTIWVKA